MEALGIEISWPSRKPREKPSRVHNHHVSLRDRIKDLKHHHHHPPKAGGAGGDKETTAKAVAWAVFQHHGEGGGLHHGHTHGIAVRRPTRFKIEAQMRHELAHRSVVVEDAAAKWDAGSTLFDSFELHSLLKTLDDAAHASTAAQKSHGDGEAGAMIVCTPPKSPTHWTSDEKLRVPGEAQKRYNLTANVKHGREHHREDGSSVFGQLLGRRSFDNASEKPAAKADDSHHHHHHHSKWKSLLHTLHLDGAHGLFHKSHTQVAPHDLEQKSRLRHKDGSQERYDGHFERSDLAISKDVNPPAENEEDHHRHHHHHPHFWKFGFKPFCRAGHATLSDSEDSDCEDPHPKKEYHGHRQTDLRKAWSSLTANLLHHHHHHHDTPAVIEHHHHHHHHHHHEVVQATSRRASRDEKVRRVSSEEGGLKTPRNSLETVVVSVCT